MVQLRYKANGSAVMTDTSLVRARGVDGATVASPLLSMVRRSSASGRGFGVAALGRRDEAIRAYRQFLALRSAPEPSLRPDAAAARSALAGLERVSAPR